MSALRTGFLSTFLEKHVPQAGQAGMPPSYVINATSSAHYPLPSTLDQHFSIRIGKFTQAVIGHLLLRDDELSLTCPCPPVSLQGQQQLEVEVTLKPEK
jgi:hypothetical protein